MSNGASGTSSALNGRWRPFTAIEKAVQKIILDPYEQYRPGEILGFRVLAYPAFFKANLNRAVSDPDTLSEPDEDQVLNIIDAVEQGYGAIIVCAEREGWDDKYTRQELILHRHRREKKSEKTDGPKKHKNQFDLLLEILRWYRDEFKISPEIRSPITSIRKRAKWFPSSPWRTRRYPFPQFLSKIDKKDNEIRWQTKNTRKTNLTSVIVAIIAAIAGIIVALVTTIVVPELSQRERVQAVLDRVLGEKKDNNEDKLKVIEDKLKDISDQLDKLVGFFTPVNPGAADGSSPRLATLSITDFLDRIVSFIRNFFSGLIPGFLVNPEGRSTLGDRMNEWQTGARGWLADITTELTTGLFNVWNWIIASIQSVIGQATGQPPALPASGSGN